ncbi:abl interactor 2-like [Anneissia japonica]|uniref:abl interactor 2-like n=1 Tax=Anneissia japonica TaxID=1529436 RepID=UPI0014259B3B|nr:abl interactor 2-like [Anneissia japonica]
MSALETLFDNEIPAGRQALENSQANLLDVAAYCEDNYVKAEDKRVALEETKNYTTQSLASVAYQINTLATSMLQMLDLQVNQLSTMEASVNHIAQTVSIHKEKVARREIGVLTTNKNVTRTHKIIAPANPERPAKYKSKIIDYTSLDSIGHGLKIGQPKQRTLSRSSEHNAPAGASLPIVQPHSQYGTIRTQPGVRPVSTPRVPGYADVGQSQSLQRKGGPPPPPSMPQQVHPNQSNVSPYIQHDLSQSQQNQPNIAPVRPAPAPPPPPAPMPSSIPPPPPPMAPPDMMAGVPPPPPPADNGYNRVPYSHQDQIPPPPSNPVDDRPSGFSMSELNRALSINRKSSGGYGDEFADMPPPPPPDEPPAFDMTMSPLPPPPPENFEAIDYDAMMPPPPPPQFLQEDEPEWVPKDYIQKVVAIYDYIANQDDELTFQEGNIIYVVKMNEDGWYEGVMEGVTGLFPGNHVDICP